MNSMSKMVIVFMVVQLFSGIVNAQSTNQDQITFTVPLRLYNMDPAVNWIEVGGQATSPGAHIVAFGQQTVSMPANGTLEQDVIVVVSESEGQDIRLATTWRVWFRIVYGSRAGAPDSECSSSEIAGENGPCCAKPGTPFVWETTGEIVW